MENMQSTANVLRKVALMTLVGFLVVILAGPILSILGILLPFALVGFVVWLAFRVLVRGREVGWRVAREHGERVLRFAFALPIWLARHLGAGARRLGQMTRTFAGIAGALFLPTLAGAFFGALLGAIGGIEHQDAAFRIPAGALIGACIGAVAGTIRDRPAKVLAVNPAPEVAERV